MTRAEQPAFPEIHIYHWKAQDKEVGKTDNVTPRWMGGLTKREYFAAMAMQGILSANFPHGPMQDEKNSAAHYAVVIAEALIAELNK